ncbi:GNAT family N-acetyltransferase [Maritalea sp.]|jgi:GNAT superfamily N-acetyltransferase|uniref:GNAT family N-acetyltransferase n=1 Tax=Maritalea sp. TaxID=2003361 RepID=UPI0039E72280
MSMPELIEVTAENVEKTRFFCKMSAKGKPGYERKMAWLKKRFNEGLQMRLLGDGERGFVEYIPGDFAWRGIDNASRYLVIHCLWVVGKSKGKGFGKYLLQHVIDQAKQEGYAGVAALTSSGNWLINNKILKAGGFESVEQVKPFDLMVKRFDESVAIPNIVGDFENKAKLVPSGMAVYRTDQCPYIDDAVINCKAFADERGWEFTQIEMDSAADLRKLCPTPYGTFAITLDGKFLSYTYMLRKDFVKLGL